MRQNNQNGALVNTANNNFQKNESEGDDLTPLQKECPSGAESRGAESGWGKDQADSQKPKHKLIRWISKIFDKLPTKLLLFSALFILLSVLILGVAFNHLELKLDQYNNKLSQLAWEFDHLRAADGNLISLHAGQFRIRKNRPRTAPVEDPAKDKYDFDKSIQDLIRNSDLQKAYQYSDDYFGIKKPEFERAIRMFELVHNINYKGEFEFDHYRFYNSAFEKYVALKKLVSQQKRYYEEKYNISKYIHNQIRFCIFTTSYNNARNRLYLRNLDSIFQQQYQNYHIVYGSDASTDGTAVYVQAYMEVNQIPKDKYTVIQNKKNIGGGANLYMAAHEYCQPGEVMLLIDGDDALIGRQVFALLNAVYQKQKPLLLYSQFLYVYPTKIGAGTCRPIPEEILKSDSFRDNKRLYSSHIKTMYVDLYRKIKREDLEYEKGKIIAYGADVSFMTPMIEMAGQRVYYLPEILYEYRSDTGSNDPGEKQEQMTKLIFSRPKYSRIQDTEFADNPRTTYYP